MECERKGSGQEWLRGLRPERKDAAASHGWRADKLGVRGTWTSAQDRYLDGKVGSAMSIRCSRVMPGRQLDNAVGTSGEKKGFHAVRLKERAGIREEVLGPSCDKRRKRGTRRGYEEASSR